MYGTQIQNTDTQDTQDTGTQTQCVIHNTQSMMHKSKIECMVHRYTDAQDTQHTQDTDTQKHSVLYTTHKA